MEKRNVRVSAGAEALSVLGLVLAVVTVISPFWGRFSNEGNPNTGGNTFNIHSFFLLNIFEIYLIIVKERNKERERESKEKIRKRQSNNTLCFRESLCFWKGNTASERVSEEEEGNEVNVLLSLCLQVILV
jgi:hypothetical protein